MYLAFFKQVVIDGVNRQLHVLAAPHPLHLWLAQQMDIPPFAIAVADLYLTVILIELQQQPGRVFGLFRRLGFRF